MKEEFTLKCCSYKIGTILDISDSFDGNYKFITIGNDPKDIYSQVRLVYSNETLIVNCEYNEISVYDLYVGNRIVAYHSNVMTMSIPPQTNALIIEVK